MDEDLFLREGQDITLLLWGKIMESSGSWLVEYPGAQFEDAVSEGLAF